MCDLTMPPIYQTISIHPSETVSVHSSGLGWAGTEIVCMIAVLATIILMGSMAFRRVERPRMKMAVLLCVLTASGWSASGEVPTTLNVYGPHDDLISDGIIKEITEDYCDEYGTAVNITCVNGRKALLDAVVKSGETVDLVILEEEYPLFNLSGMKTLTDKGLIESCHYLYRKRALMILQRGVSVSSLDDLNGKKVAVTDQHVPGACLSLEIIKFAGLNVTNVTVESTEAQLDAVIDGRADATILWDSIFESCTNSTREEIEVVVLPEFGMDNFVAVLKDTPNRAETERYETYLLEGVSGQSRPDLSGSKAEA
ncbi:MAG TPA: ABC transporter substrate-binding protein [Methanothrix sp.]|nr:ABC transporter substrate-binding protein [Methanothrix sp.]